MQLTFTDKAADKTASLIAEENDTSDLFLRVFIQGGGCSGFQYGFTFDKEKGTSDWIFETKGVELLVDPVSMAYLKDATIDFEDDVLKGSQFIIKNPQAKSTCGCGSSFAT